MTPGAALPDTAAVLDPAAAPARAAAALADALRALAVPVDPDRETARRWAVEELSEPEYARARPNIVVRAVQWLLEWLGDLVVALPGPPDITGAVVAALAAVLALAAVTTVLWLVTGPLRRTARSRPARGPVFGDTARTAGEHRTAARAAADRGDWREAVQESFRAVVRGLGERGIVEVRRGRTADEVAADATVAFPDAAADLRAAAVLFDDVAYGGRPGSPSAYERVTALDATLDRSRPQLAVG